MVFGTFITTEARTTLRVHYDNLKSAHYSEDYLSTFRHAAITIFTIYCAAFTNCDSLVLDFALLFHFQAT